MDFFERQHTAKRTTAILVVMFFLVCAVLVFAIMFVASQLAHFDDSIGVSANLLHPWSLGAGITTMGLILLGAFIEWLRLGKGGHALAKRLNAKRIYKPTPQTDIDALNTAVTDSNAQASSNKRVKLTKQEAQLFSIVENMAIASGMSEPSVYVLTHEVGINAFVAGFKARDMVLVVTQGALDKLDENELYGIVGHEFSHIAHGDTKLNLRLLVLLGGLQLIYELSGFIFTFGRQDRTPDYSKSGWGSDIFFGSSDKGSGKGGGAVFIVLTFLFLVFCISSVGVFAARLIKFATLRQCEYLADAASVQYTRSFGVLDALIKIRNLPMHSSIYHPSRQALSHLFFASSLPQTDVFEGVFSTHPTLDKRIKALSNHTFERIKIEDEVRQQQAIDKQIKQHQAKEHFTKQRLFELKQPSSYDGTPVEFISFEKAPPNLLPKKAVQPTISTGELSSIPQEVNKASTSQFMLQNATLSALPLRPSKQNVSSRHPNKPFSSDSLTIAIEDKDIAGFDQSTKAGRLIHEAIKQPKGALEIIAASLSHHQQRTGVIEKFRPEDYEVSRVLYKAIHSYVGKGVADEVVLTVKAIENVPDLAGRVSRSDALIYLDRLRRIISLDGKVSLLEHLLLERVADKLGLFTELYTLDYVKTEQVQAACIKLIYGMLHADGHDKQDKNRITLRMCRLLGLPIDLEALKPLVSIATQQNLTECLSVLRVQNMIKTSTIINTFETTMLADGDFNTDEAAIIAQLQWRFNT